MKTKAMDEILAMNPKAREHADSIREAMDLLDTVRKMGVKPSGYRLRSPFERRDPRILRRVGGLSKLRLK